MSGQAKFLAKKHLAIAVLLTFVALGFRLFIALRLPTDEPDDGRLYARIANNLLDHHVYTIATEEPFEPTYIRLPGYPVFLAAVYKLFGRDNNTAVRVIQAVVDTVTCWLIAWLALAWTPLAWELEKRRRALLIALALAASCPYLAIYVATILTEIWTAFFATLCALAASLGLRSRSPKKQVAWWALAGLAGGGATSFRPDGGLFVAAVGGTLAVVGVARAFSQWLAARKSNQPDKTPLAYSAARQALAKTILQGAVLTLGFVLAIAPWTIRNARVFGVFMPIAPAQANMPDEFVPRGFILWLKTWVDDVKYTETVEWAMDVRAIHIEQIPETAFDSPDERDRVAALLASYNKEVELPAPSAKPEIEDEAAAAPTPPAEAAPDNDETTPSDNDKSPGDDAASDDDTSNDEEPPEAAEPPKFEGEMTPDIDAGFMEIAVERVHCYPLRYYVVMPLRRAASLWFDTHSQYYPFQGELLPLKDLDSDLHQQYWLPLFAGLTWLYTLLAALGAWVMWRWCDSRRWLLMLALLVLPRLAFLSTLENPEPRYVVELFTFVMAAASLSFAGPVWSGALRWLRRQSSDSPANG